MPQTNNSTVDLQGELERWAQNPPAPRQPLYLNAGWRDRGLDIVPVVNLEAERAQWMVAPPPFNYDSFFNDYAKDLSLVDRGIKKDALTNWLAGFAQDIPRFGEAMGYNTMAAMSRGVASFFTNLDILTRYVDRVVGMEQRGGGFAEIAANSQWSEEYWKKRANEVGYGFFEELVADILGEAVPGVTQFALDISSGLTLPLARGAQVNYEQGESPLLGGLTEAARTLILHSLFRMAGPMKRYLRSISLGLVGGGEAALEAPEGEKAKAFSKGFGTMAIYSMTSNGGRLGMNELVRNGNELLLEVPAKLRMREIGTKIRDTYEDLTIGGKTMTLGQAMRDEGGYFEKLDREQREYLYQRLTNRFLSLENLPERAMKLGMRKPKPGENVKLLTRSYLGIAGQVKSVLEKSTFKIDADGQIVITGEGLKPILDDFQKGSSIGVPKKVFKGFKNAEEMINDLDVYLKTTRILEDLRKPVNERTEETLASGVTIEDAQIALEHLKSKYGDLSNFEAIQPRIASYSRRVLHLLVDSGRISEADYDAMIRRHPHYVPFQYVQDIEEHVSMKGGGNEPFSEVPKGVKPMKGGKEKTLAEIESPLEQLVKYTYRIMDIASRNRIAKIVGIMSGIDGLDMERVPIPIRPIMVKADEINTFKQEIRRQTEELKREVRTSQTEGGTAQVPATRPMQKLETIIKESLVSRGFTEGEAESALERVKRAAAKQEPAPAETQTVTESVETTIDRLVKVTSEIFERPKDTTIFRPSDYVPPNTIVYFENGKKRMVRVPDNLYEAMTGFNEIQAGAALKIARAMSTLLRKGVTMSPDFWVRNFVRDNQNAMIMSTTGFRPLIDPALVFSHVIGRTDLYYDWLRSGAAHSTFVELSKPQLDYMLKQVTNNVSNLRHLNIFAEAEKISLAVEESTRVALFRSGRKHGLSDLESMLEAREGTTDFGVRGSSKSMQIASQSIAFLNPAIQGVMRSFRAQKTHPFSTTLKALVMVSLPSFLTWYYNKDDERYNEIQRYILDLSWPIMGSENIGLVPKPFTFGQLYGSSLERFLDWSIKKDPHAFDEFYKSILEAVTPVQGDWRGSLLITAFKPVIENAMDWSMFREMPIVPEATEKLMQEYQYTKYSTETAKLLGKYYKMLPWEETGASPAKVENLVRGYLGGSGMYGLELSDLIIRMFQDESELKGKRPAELADYPVLHSFFARPPESTPRSLKIFYENADKVSRSYNTYLNQLAELEPKTAVEIMEKNPLMLLMPTVRELRNGIRELNRQIQIISWLKIDKDEKRKLISSLEVQRMMIARAGNQLIENSGLPEEISADSLDTIEQFKEAGEGIPKELQDSISSDISKRLEERRKLAEEGRTEKGESVQDLIERIDREMYENEE